MEKELQDYLNYLLAEKKISKHTFVAYKADIEKFLAYLHEKSVDDWGKISKTFVIGYVLKLKEEGRASSTILRNISAIRSFSDFLILKGILKVDPTLGIDIPQGKKTDVEYLTIEEIELLLSQPDESMKGIRDRAILETLYGTGVKVSELIDLKVEDVNIRMKFITCSGDHGKPRIIPLGKMAAEALRKYMEEFRKKIVKGEDEHAFFLNLSGTGLSRQGLWKIIKKYAAESNLGKEITPVTLRHSFGVHLVQNGADLKSVQELMGHSDISTTQIYADIIKYRLKEVYDRTHPRA